MPAPNQEKIIVRKAVSVILNFFLTLISWAHATPKSGVKPIARYALVNRHNIVWNDFKGQFPLGNGEFCFNADGKGLTLALF